MSEEKKRKELRLTSRAKLIVDRVIEKPDVPVEWPSAIGHALSELTPKQRHFTVCLAGGMAQSDAYKRAYNADEDTLKSTLYTSSSMLKSHPKVSEALKLLLAWLDRQWLLDSKEVIEYGYQRLYEEAENGPDSADRTRATIALLKAHGAFVSRSEVRHIHETDPSGTVELLSAIKDVIGLAVPKPLPQLEQANVASVELIDAETDSTNL